MKIKIDSSVRKGYEAFVLADGVRKRLAKIFPPKYPEWIGHHITNRFGVQREESQPFGKSSDFAVIGYAEDDGIEALVVSRDGSSKRPDGKVYHITWSLDRTKGRKPVDSNKVLAEKGYITVAPIAFTAPLEYLS